MRWIGEYVSFANKDDPEPSPASRTEEKAEGIGAVLLEEDSDETAGL